MAIFKCKMCGGDLEITKGELTTECSFCGSHQTLPRLDSDKKVNLYDRANHFRRANDFDKAMGIYAQILNEDNTDAEAYWSIVLCRYGIEYVEEPSSHKRVPAVNRAQYTSIFADEDYKLALQKADLSQKSIYEQEAKAIDEVLKGILEIAQKEEPFDVFLCYKETDNSGRRTQDSVLANDLYHQLAQEGFKVFFSRITLEDKLGIAYEPYIFAALNSAKVMVVLGTKPEYFNAVWVKNEWSRYLALIKNGAKKVLIPAYRDMDPYDLPDEFSHLQAQDMSKLGFMQEFMREIKKIFDETADKPAVDETLVVAQATPANSNVQALLDRGNMALEDCEWEKADGFFEEVLNQDAKCAEAYLGKLLAREKKSSFDAYVAGQCSKYSDADSEKLEACPENIDAINDAVSKYTIENYVKESEITILFEYDRSYLSCLSKREKQKEYLLGELESDKIFARIRQYMSGELAEQINNGVAKIEDSLNARIAKAREDDDKSITSVTAAYNNHVTSAAGKAREIYDEACEKREADYQSYVAKMQSAEDVNTYGSAAYGFGRLGTYKDSLKNIEYCNSEINMLNMAAKAERESVETERKRPAKVAVRTKKIAIISVASIAAIIAVCIIVSLVMKANKYKDAKTALAERQQDDAVAESEETGNGEDSANQQVLKIDKDGVVHFGNNDWLVLEKEDGKVLLLSKDVIKKMPYDNIHMAYHMYVTWENCTLRKWLNNDYLNSAFNETERNAIVATPVVNADNSLYGTDGGNATTDKIFLLSIEEVKKYFAKDKDRIALTTEGKSAWWWLRSPGRISYSVAYTNSDGSISSYGDFVTSETGAVRPALWVDISKL